MEQHDFIEFIAKTVELNGLKTETCFAKFLAKNTNVRDEIILNSSGVFGLFFEDHTYDGWYCIKDKKLEWYYVYFKEHGMVHSFNNVLQTKVQEEAIGKVLVCYGALKF
ncbi:hypothetical protein ACPV54_01165 [Vibrio mediterranei]